MRNDDSQIDIEGQDVEIQGDVVGHNKTTIINFVIPASVFGLLLGVAFFFAFVALSGEQNSPHPPRPTRNPNLALSATPTPGKGFGIAPATATLLAPTPIPSLPKNSTPTLALAAKTTRIAKDGSAQVYLPEGEFLMGRDVSAQKDERPAHKVFIPAIWMDKNEVTVGRYLECVKAVGCAPVNRDGPPDRLDYFSNPAYLNHPMLSVTWLEAVAYCTWLDKRLPTEAEWEKAARGNNPNYLYPWGNADSTQNIANYDNFYRGTIAINSFRDGRSPYDIMELAGNVAEWVNDWYDETYYESSPAQDPKGNSQGQAKVYRGGAYDTNAYSIRVTTRASANPNQRFFNIGFRCVQSIP